MTDSNEALIKSVFNPLNTKLNPICHLLALLEAHHIFHISRIRVNKLSKFLYNQIWYFMDTCPRIYTQDFFITFSASSSVTSFLIRYFRDISLGTTSCTPDRSYSQPCGGIIKQFLKLMYVK